MKIPNFLFVLMDFQYINFDSTQFQYTPILTKVPRGSRRLVAIFEEEIKFWSILPFKKLKSDQRFKSYSTFCQPTYFF